jgi:hypothetical protein
LKTLAYDPSAQEAEAGVSGVSGQPGLHNEPCFNRLKKNNKKKTKEEKIKAFKNRPT